MARSRIQGQKIFPKSVKGEHIADKSVGRSHLLTDLLNQSVIVRIIPGTGVTISSTGADPGTGDVTISLSPSALQWGLLNSTDIYYDGKVSIGGKKTNTNSQLSVIGDIDADSLLGRITKTYESSDKMKLLLLMEGLVGSSNIVDTQGHQVTSSNVLLSDSWFSSGHSSAYFNGTGKLTIPGQDFNLNSNFTIQLDFKLSEFPSNSPEGYFHLIGKSSYGVLTQSLLYINNNELVYKHGDTTITAPYSFNLGVGYRVELSVINNLARLFINGRELASGSISTITYSSQDLTIGRSLNDKAGLRGYIDSIRVMDGIGLFSKNHVVRTIDHLPIEVITIDGYVATNEITANTYNNLPRTSKDSYGVLKVGTGLTVTDGVVNTVPYQLPQASQSTLGGVRVGSGLTIDQSTGLLSATQYELPPATTVTLGGIRVGAGLTVDSLGIVSVIPYSYTLPQASETTLGGVRVGDGLSIVDGKLTAAVKTNYVLPQASASTIGGVRVGNGLSIDPLTGILSVPTALPATTNRLGGVIVGQGLKVSDTGVISVDTAIVGGGGGSLDIATSTRLGVIRVGTGLTIDASGVLSATGVQFGIATSTTLGGIKVGAGLSIDGTGVLSATAQPYVLPKATNTQVGGVRVGSGISVDPDGIISVSVPVATSSSSGIVRPGSGLVVDNNGVLSVEGIPPATPTRLGVIRVGSGLQIDVNGVLNVTSANASISNLTDVSLTTLAPNSVLNYNGSFWTNTVLSDLAYQKANAVNITGGLINGVSITNAVISQSTYNNLPLGSTSQAGIVRIGSGLSVSSGVISVDTTLITKATTTAPGIVQIGSGLLVDVTGVVSLDPNFVLSPATASKLGGIKVGSGLSITAEGELSVVSTYTLPKASDTVLGGIRVGSGLSIAADGTLSSSIGLATTLIPGLVRAGSGLSVDASGILSVTATGSNLVTLSDVVISTLQNNQILKYDQSSGKWINSNLGVGSLGSQDLNNVSITGGNISNVNISAASYSNLPLATKAIKGVVQIGDGINVSVGTISLAPPSATTLGGVKPGQGIFIDTDGTISVSASGSALATLGDVTLTNPQNGQYLVYNFLTKKWVNATLAIGSIAAQDSSGVAITGGNISGVTINASSYQNLPKATESTYGVVRPGAGLTITDGVISSSLASQKASYTQLGSIMIGSGLTIDAAGVVSVVALGSMLATLSDVGILNPTEGQVLKYNSTTGKWVNSSTEFSTISSSTQLGLVKVGSGLSITPDGTLNLSYTPTPTPTASASVKGIVRVGGGLSIDSDGVLSVNALGANLFSLNDVSISNATSGHYLTYNGAKWSNSTFPISSTTKLGGVIVGEGLAVSQTGVLSVASNYNLPKASDTVLGGIKIGSGLTIDANGVVDVVAKGSTLATLADVSLTSLQTGQVLVYNNTTNRWSNSIKLGGMAQQEPNAVMITGGSITGVNINAQSYQNLPLATNLVPGMVRPGDGLSVTNGVMSIVTQYQLPKATNSTLGGIVVGEGLATDANGVLRVTATGSALNSLSDVQLVSPTTGQTITYDEYDGKWKNTSISFDGNKMVVSQIGHGFEVSDLVGLSGNYFVKCRAFSRQESEVYGIVTRIVGSNEFELTVSGLVSNLTGLVKGTTYYLSEINHGKFTSTEPTGAGYVSKPVLLALSTSVAIFINQRGFVNP